MKFSRVVFLIAAIWGVLLIGPLYFLLDLIGRIDPPAITHPVYFYGFAGVALAWQIAFFIIAKNPARYRPFMIPSILEKVAYGGAVAILFLLFAALFIVAYRKVGTHGGNSRNYD